MIARRFEETYRLRPAGWRVPRPLSYKALRSAETFGINIPACNVKIRT